MNAPGSVIEKYILHEIFSREIPKKKSFLPLMALQLEILTFMKKSWKWRKDQVGKMEVSGVSDQDSLV